MSQDPSGADTAGRGYDPDQDPDSDPEMMTERHPSQDGENDRDPAEGADDESAIDG